MILIILLSCIFDHIETATLSNAFPKCYQNDPKLNECFVKAANSLNDFVKNGVPEIGMRTLNPYVSSGFNITLETPITDFAAYTTNFTLFKMYDYQFEEVDIRPKEGKISGKVVLPKWGLWTNYEILGQMISVEVKGSGTVTCECDRTVCEFSLSNWFDTSNCKDINVDIVCKLDDMSINFTGMANEEVVNTLLNLSSRLFASEVSPAFSSIFQGFMKQFTTRICRKFKFSELIPPSP
ncbi:hypothetical protein PPYR_08551 [Photinus pyralis]|uniref:Uncharacterized protein n=2 Tax=Photinus pyralis TaxID=7054 RepID=A0A5N4AK15_PHOPY|nr:uncharacterized protein LOC116172493 [Photinus pyralis]KAB0797558.1 hypothetical protein PPYR_08551 [Photinus pyralis]